MPIEIITYRDPYRMNQDSYWDKVRDCPYFCVSQTLVNGLKSLYQNDFQKGRVTTVQKLLEKMFPDWESAAKVIKQHTIIDNLVARRMDGDQSGTLTNNIAKSFLFNREEVFKSIRIY